MSARTVPPRAKPSYEAQLKAEFVRGGDDGPGRRTGLFKDATEATRASPAIIRDCIEAAERVVSLAVALDVEEDKVTGKRFAAINAKIAALEQTLASANARAALIEVENAGLQAELSTLRGRIQSLSSAETRRETRARKAPTPAAKPNANGAKSRDAATLPGFVTQ
jgi:hypothetical protein